MTIYRINMCGNDQQHEHDTIDYIPSKDRVTNWDVAGFVISIINHLVDVGFDLFLAYQYYIGKDPAYFYITLAFIVIPAFVSTAFSIRMYYLNQDKTKTLTKKFTKRRLCYIIVLIFQLAPVLRYFDALTYALKSKKAEKTKDVQTQRKYYLLMVREDSDIALLRVLECFLEAAPQQILQLTIIFHGQGTNESDEISSYFFFQLLSIGSSFASMAWSMASYHRLLRVSLINKNNISWGGTVMQFMWHFLVTVSRILCISVALSTLLSITITAITFHWMIMVLWLHLSTKSSNFCDNNKLYEFFFYAVFGTVYIFTHIPLSEGKTLVRYIFFYTILFAENLVATVTWILRADDALRNSFYYQPIVIINFLTFFVGITFMILYYKICHPSTGCMSKTPDDS